MAAIYAHVLLERMPWRCPYEAMLLTHLCAGKIQSWNDALLEQMPWRCPCEAMLLIPLCAGKVSYVKRLDALDNAYVLIPLCAGKVSYQARRNKMEKLTGLNPFVCRESFILQGSSHLRSLCYVLIPLCAGKVSYDYGSLVYEILGLNPFVCREGFILTPYLFHNKINSLRGRFPTFFNFK